MEHRDKFARPPVWAPFDRVRLEEHRKSQVQLEGIHKSLQVLQVPLEELHNHLWVAPRRRPLQIASRIAIRKRFRRW